MERRRRQPASWNGTIACRHCATPVTLRRYAIERASDGRMFTRCDSCGNSFPVRVSDPSLDVARVERPVEVLDGPRWLRLPLLVRDRRESPQVEAAVPAHTG